jgi:hypothetical protein
MRYKDIKEYIKSSNTYTIDKNMINDILNSINTNSYRMEIDLNTKARRSSKKPILIFLTILFTFLFPITIYAINNTDVSQYFKSIFNIDNKNTNGQLINKNAESDGISISVDAAAVENNSFILFYTVTNDFGDLFKEKADLFNASLKLNDRFYNYSTSYHGIANGRPNYILCNSDGFLELKGKQNAEFTTQGLLLTEHSKTYEIPIDKDNYKLDETSLLVNTKMENDNIEVTLNKNKETMYEPLQYPILKNKYTGSVYYPMETSVAESLDGSTILYRWIYNALDSEVVSDYDLNLDICPIYKFKIPIKIAFKIDFDHRLNKIIYPVNAYVSSANIDKISLSKVSILVDLTLSDYKTITNYDKESLNIYIKDNTGEIIQSILTLNTSPYDNEGTFSYFMLLSKEIDYTKEPILYINDLEIKLE